MEKCIFLGYPEDYKGWKFYNPTSKRTLISERANFDERYFPMSKRLPLPSQPPPTAPIPVLLSLPVEYFNPGATLDSESECNEVVDHGGSPYHYLLIQNPLLFLMRLLHPLCAPLLQIHVPDRLVLLESVPDCLCATDTNLGSGGSSLLRNWMTQIRWRRVMMSWQCLHLSLMIHSRFQRLSLALMLRSEDRPLWKN